jgi:hypothetical protein
MTKRFWTLIVLLAVSSHRAWAQGAPAAVVANSPTVLEITAFDCPGHSKHRLTGFVAQGYIGILTALHGVVGCKILAERQRPYELYPDLRILRADVERDVALLFSTKVQEDISAQKLRATRVAAVPPRGSRIFVVGYPANVSEPFANDLTIDDTTKTLQFLPAGVARDALERRNSPSFNHPIVTVGGLLQPGHSGAPLTTIEGSAIAIGDGGVVGTTGIGWAIPIKDLQLVETAALQPVFDKLIDGQSQGLFAYEESRVQPAGLSATFSLAVAPTSDGPEYRATLEIPRFLVGHRFAGVVDGGTTQNGLSQQLTTLPGTNPSVFSATVKRSYVEAGVKYFFRAVPRGAVDPYAAFSAGTTWTKGSTSRLQVTAAAGIDLPVSHRLVAYSEFAMTSANVSDALTVFNRFGNADVVPQYRWLRADKIFLGLKFAFGSLGVQ